MARTSSLNCLSCRNPYQAPHSLNPSPLFTENPFFFTEKCFVGSPAQKSAQIFSTLFDPGAERPRGTFFNFLGVRVRRARRTPLRGPGDFNAGIEKSAVDHWVDVPARVLLSKRRKRMNYDLSMNFRREMR